MPVGSQDGLDDWLISAGSDKTIAPLGMPGHLFGDAVLMHRFDQFAGAVSPCWRSPGSAARPEGRRLHSEVMCDSKLISGDVERTVKDAEDVNITIALTR
jgi:hypothetical protein